MVWAVHEGRDGTLWIGTDAGLDRLDRRTGRITHYTPDPADPQSLSYRQVKTLYEDRDGVLWVGTWGGGLNRLVLSAAEGSDRATGRFAAYRHDPNDSTSISSNRVEDILEDRQGILWISTNDGFNRFDRATETFTRYTTRNISFEGEPTNMIHVLFGAVYEDDQGVLWVGTAGGLNRFDRSTGRLRLNAPVGRKALQGTVKAVEPTARPDPEHALVVFVDGQHRIMAQARGVVGVVPVRGKTISVILLQALIRREPHETLVVLNYFVDGIGSEAVRRREVLEGVWLRLGVQAERPRQKEKEGQQGYFKSSVHGRPPAVSLLPSCPIR